MNKKGHELSKEIWLGVADRLQSAGQVIAGVMQKNGG